MKKYVITLLSAAFLFSCKPDPVVRENPYKDISNGVTIVGASAQRYGDPEAGRIYLTTADYIDSGIPREIYNQTLGANAAKLNLLGRDGINEDLPYDYNGYVTQDGVSLVATNCLQCHAGYVDNTFVMGLGNTFANYTSNQAGLITLVDNFVISAYGEDSPEFKAYEPFSRGLKATAPHLVLETVGSNPADKLALVLAAHRNPDDLSWSDMLNFPIPEETIPADVPPWWHMKKKNAMFSTGLGKGDFSKHMMTASILTIEDTVKANEIDANFPDVLAYLQTLEAPIYTGTIDQVKADRGLLLFEENCSKCHGTYGDNESYPNLFVDQNLIETDPALADGTELYTEFVGWFNNSWFSNSAFPAEYTQVDGYLAPPLDGIWATAPYFHNGSVPTLSHILKSTARPAIWKKTSSLANYDHSLMGISHVVEDSKSDSYSYDTNLLGHGNGGHYFSDYLTDDQRSDLLEYLKTL